MQIIWVFSILVFPQGSCLRLLLFLFITNSMLHSLTKDKLTACADDTNLTHSDKNLGPFYMFPASGLAT